jgi:hypothetical protein
MTEEQSKLPPWIISLLLTACSIFIFSCNESYKLGPSFISHPNDASKRVEYYIKKPIGKEPYPAIIFIHGHQTAVKPGGKRFCKLGCA